MSNTKKTEMMQPKDILNDVLASTKSLFKLYSTFSTEVSNEDTLFTIEEGESEIRNLQRDAFNLLYSKGWYQVEADTNKNISSTYNQFLKSKKDL